MITVIELDEVFLSSTLTVLEISNLCMSTCSHLIDKLATIDRKNDEVANMFVDWCIPFVKKFLKDDFDNILSRFSEIDKTDRFSRPTLMSILRYSRSPVEDLMDTIRCVLPIEIDNYIHPAIMIDTVLFIHDICIRALATRTGSAIRTLAEAICCHDVLVRFKSILKYLDVPPIDNRLEVSYVIVRLEHKALMSD